MTHGLSLFGDSVNPTLGFTTIKFWFLGRL